jgi:hypothetical protein
MQEIDSRGSLGLLGKERVEDPVSKAAAHHRQDGRQYYEPGFEFPGQSGNGDTYFGPEL